MSHTTPQDITMTKTDEEFFFALVRAGLWNTPIQFTLPEGEQIHWPVIIAHLQRQTIDGVVAPAVLQLPKALQPDVMTLQYFIKRIGANIKTHAAHNQAICEIFTHLQDNGFHPVLLKGQGNAQHYLNPTTRSCGDIDIYLGNDDFEKAQDCVIRFINSSKEDGEFRNPKHFTIHYKDILLELHKYVIDSKDLQFDEYLYNFEKKWLDTNKVKFFSNIAGCDICVPPLQFNVVYVFQHIVGHLFFGGVGLRQIIDWSMMLHAYHDKVDSEQLKKDLEGLELMQLWQTMGCFVVKHLGLPQTEIPFYDPHYESKLPYVWKNIKENGNFGHYGDWMANQKNRKTLARYLHTLIYGPKHIFSLFNISPKYTFCTLKKLVNKGIYRLKHF